MDCPLCESGYLCEVHDCRCPEVKVGGKPTGSKNWNPDCPVHPWDEKLQAQSDRAVEWQRKAAEARRKARLIKEARHVIDLGDDDEYRGGQQLAEMVLEYFQA